MKILVFRGFLRTYRYPGGSSYSCNLDRNGLDGSLCCFYLGESGIGISPSFSIFLYLLCPKFKAAILKEQHTKRGDKESYEQRYKSSPRRAHCSQSTYSSCFTGSTDNTSSTSCCTNPLICISESGNQVSYSAVLGRKSWDASYVLFMTATCPYPERESVNKETRHETYQDKP